MLICLRLLMCVLILLAIMVACDKRIALPGVDKEPTLGEERRIIENAELGIRGKAEATIQIAEAAVKSTKATPGEWSDVKGLQTQIIELTNQLGEANKELGVLEEKVSSYVETIQKLTDEVNRSNRQKWFWMAFSSAWMIVIAAGISVWLKDSTILMAGGAAGAVGIGVGTFMSSSSWIVTAVMAVIVVSATGVGGLMVWRKLKKQTDEEYKDADSMAEMARSSLRSDKPETVREFFAKMRQWWPAFDESWKKLNASVDVEPKPEAS